MSSNDNTIKECSVIRAHHYQQQVCATRPRYREGRKPKAVKVYTVAQESKHLLVHGNSKLMPL